MPSGAAGAALHYVPLYTSYWPLPVDFGQFNPVGGLLFILGVALIMVGTLLFIFNIFATVFFLGRW